MPAAFTGNLVARALLLISAAVVLGLSISLYQDFSQQLRGIGCEQYPDNCRQLGLDRVPATFAYGAAAGTFGMIDGFIGLTTPFLDAIPWIITAVVDGLVAIVLLAHGINLSVLMGQLDVTLGDDSPGAYATRSETDAAFAFIGVIAICVACVMMRLSRDG